MRGAVHEIFHVKWFFGILIFYIFPAKQPKSNHLCLHHLIHFFVEGINACAGNQKLNGFIMHP